MSNKYKQSGNWTKVSELKPGMFIAVPKEEIGIGTDDVLWDEIVAINHIGRERVYDIEVEGTHNFVGNDIFAHNTYINNDLIKILANNLDVGDIVRPASGSQRFVIATTTDENQVAGVVTVTPATSGGASTSIAFSGQAMVKVSAENGVVKVGDRLALSHTQPGIAVKATTAGMTIGIAMEDSTTDKVLTLVNAGYWAPSVDTGNVTVSAGGGPAFGWDVLATLANAVLTRVQSIWASGDIIVEGLKKTYYKLADLLPGVDVANWLSREVAISDSADATTKSMFEGNGAQASGDSKLNTAENGEYLATYGVDSTRGEIQLSGTADLVNGEARIFFDSSFTVVISDKTPIKVMVTPSTSSITGQLYVNQKTVFGIVVKELNGSSNGKFDWLIIARRIGYDDPTPTPTPQPEAGPPPAETPMPDVTPIPSETPSATSSPTPSPSPTPDATPTPTPDITPSPTLEPTPTPEPTPEVTPAPTPDPAP